MSNTKGLAYMMQNMQPGAIANVKGDSEHPQLSGTVSFYGIQDGTLVVAEFYGLPFDNECCDQEEVYGFHIHQGNQCTGNSKDPFANAGQHFNPGNCPHPEHAGDLPPLFGNNGYAWMAVITNRFTVNEIIGRTVIVHEDPDDFHSQPSGDSGDKIGCGVIQAKS